MSTNEQNYREFLKAVQPYAVALNSCTVKLDRGAFARLFESDATRAKILTKVDANYALAGLRDDYFDVTGHLSFTVGNSATAPLSIECEFGAHLHPGGTSQRNFAERFAESEARLILWPYFREFVAQTMVRMGIQPVVLPLTVRQLESPDRESTTGSLRGRKPAAAQKQRKRSAQ